MGKISKDGEYATATIHRNKRKRERPLTPEEKEYIIDRFKKLGLINKRSTLPLGKEIEWTEKELKQQKKDLGNHNKAIKQETHKKKLKFFCNHKDIIILKNGHIICSKCEGDVAGER